MHQTPIKVSSKNYIPIWNFFSTEQESQQFNSTLSTSRPQKPGIPVVQNRKMVVMGPKKLVSSKQPAKIDPQQIEDMEFNLFASNIQTTQEQENYQPREIQVYVESNIEFTIVIPNPNLTCGWLQSEVTRRYYEVLQKQAAEWE